LVKRTEAGEGSHSSREPEAIEKYSKKNVKVYHTKFSAMLFNIFPPEEKKKEPQSPGSYAQARKRRLWVCIS
jgi:hypothetical protein